jgi:hypothetical protein
VIQELILWVVSVVTLRAQTRRIQQSRPLSLVTTGRPVLPRGYRSSTTNCTCALRSAFSYWHVSDHSFDRLLAALVPTPHISIHFTRLRAIRLGWVVATLDEKLAILAVLNTARPRQSSRPTPNYEYDDLFGFNAAKNCTCEIRRLLDTHLLTVKVVAEDLRVAPKVVTSWRRGTARPTAEQLRALHALASRQPTVVAFRGEAIDEERLPS